MILSTNLDQNPRLIRLHLRYVLECASNWGRGMLPAAQQADWWSIGGVSCSEWARDSSSRGLVVMV